MRCTKVDVPDEAPIGEDEDILNYDDLDDPDAFCINHFWTMCPEVVTAARSSWLIKGNKKKGKHNPDGISGRLQE